MPSTGVTKRLLPASTETWTRLAGPVPAAAVAAVLACRSTWDHRCCDVATLADYPAVSINVALTAGQLLAVADEPPGWPGLGASRPKTRMLAGCVPTQNVSIHHPSDTATEGGGIISLGWCARFSAVAGGDDSKGHSGKRGETDYDRTLDPRHQDHRSDDVVLGPPLSQMQFAPPSPGNAHHALMVKALGEGPARIGRRVHRSPQGSFVAMRHHRLGLDYGLVARGQGSADGSEHSEPLP